MFTAGSDRVKSIEVGYRESLLCDRCEVAINVYEKYFKRAWFDEGRCPSKPSQRIQVVGGFDYAKTKLFLLSVFWRASVASRSPFAYLQLGSHQDHIRQMILAGDPGPAGKYPFRIFLAHIDDDVATQLIECPKGAARHKNRLRTRLHRMIFAGCMWHMFVTKYGRDDLGFDGDLKENGEMHLESGDVRKIREISAFSSGTYVLRGRPI